MGDEGKDKEEPEELFEDLDKFFGPIQGVEWEREEPGPEGEAAVGGEPSPTAPEEGEEAEEEFLPQGWEAPIREVGEIGEAAPEAGGAPEGVPVGEPTAEMTEEDWARVRAAVGEEGEEAGEEGPAEEAAGAPEAEEVSVPPPAPEEERPPITLEDLRAPLAREGAEGPGEEELARVTTGAFEEEEEEPTPEAVEAAAEHFAASIREGAEDPERPEGVEGDLLADLERPAEEPRTVKVTEYLEGPSWQEPASEEVAPEVAVWTAPRNIPAALLSAAILVGLALGSIAIGKAPFAVVAGIVVLLAQGELYGVMHRKGHQPAAALGLVFGGLILGAAYFKGEVAMLSMAALATVFTFLWYMAVPERARRNAAANIGLTLLGIVYVPLLAGYVLLILNAGRALVLSVLGLTFLYDVAAFAFGSLWGSRPLAPTISPRKSWEGAVAATLAVILLAVAVVANVDPISTVGRAVGLALVVAVFAPLGDLAESIIKRDLGVKDMGSILPGHGGALDRVDSALFVAPAAVYYFRLVF